MIEVTECTKSRAEIDAVRGGLHDKKNTVCG